MFDQNKDWSQGIKIPIFKGVDIENTKNYRGITLINVFCTRYATKWLLGH